MTFSLPSNPGKAKRPAKSDFSVHIGQKLYKLRKQHRMTQQTLAGHLGVTYQQLQKYESGDNRIPVESLVILQQLFHVPYDYFFDIGVRHRFSNDFKILCILQFNLFGSF